ncbi:trypsin-like peptidase domain-containing protein [Actinoplanes solisilvae]|uniref:nSTAND1 domain-containing NTPase n=1 Tax=Actinoplanes solisilvae TaxID=2486853 RepID=UPI000FD7F8D6|nr:trypsin-like peptidase domain-containing protein [Actinoplanes solisilvae]
MDYRAEAADTWSTDLRPSVAMVLDANGRAVGTAFLTGDEWLVTCAHVLSADSAEPPSSVTVVFPHLDGKPVTLVVDRRFWRSPDREDVAFLPVAGAVPAGARSVVFGDTDDARGHQVSSFGFPVQAPTAGHYGYGRVGDEIRGDGGSLLRQLTDCSEFTEGFSGAPVLDTRTGLVIGMVDSVTRPDRLSRGSRTAYMTPVTTLRAVNPRLRPAEICPYRGLDAFEFEHARWFHGRDDDVELLVAALRQGRRALALFGPSGSGKSSLVHAGLVPRLRNGAAPGSDGWAWISARPGADPYAELDAIGLNGAAPGRLRVAVRDYIQSPHLLVVLDQFEELLVQTDAATRASFLTDLVDLVERPAPVTVVLIMRDDFYSRLAAEAPALMRILEQVIVNMPTVLTRGSLDSMIRRPLQIVGLTPQPQLTERIIDDAIDVAPGPAGAGASPTVLPLLELALTELWRQRRDGQLTHDRYEAIGRVTGGLARWCDTAFDRLPSHLHPLARTVLTSLVTPGDEAAGIPPVRRRRLRDDLHVGDDSDGLNVVLGELATARLIVTGRDPATGTATVDLIHDALIRVWGRLGDWLSADRDFRSWHARLEEQFGQWRGDPDLLLRGRVLEEAVDRRSERPVRPELDDYIELSYRDQRRRRRRDRNLIRALAVLLVLACAFSVVALVASDRARRESRVSTSVGLAAQSTNVLTDQPDLAQLLALESLRTESTPQALVSLGRVLAEPMHVSTVFDGHSGPVNDVAFSPDGQLLAGAGDDGTVRSWPATTDAAPAGVHSGHAGQAWAVAFGPGRDWLVSAGADGRLLRWHAANGSGFTELATFKTRLNALAVRPDGRVLAVGDVDGGVSLLNPADGRRLAARAAHDAPVNALAFSPDGKLLASAGGDGFIGLWTADSLRDVREPLTGHEGSVAGVAFSPDGRLASAGEDRTVRIWDPRTGRPLAEPMTGHTAAVNDVAFGRGGKALLSAGEDGVLRLWDPITGRSLGPPVRGHTGAVVSATFAPDGRTFASASADGSVRLWQYGSSRPIGQALGAHDGWVTGVAFSPDGRSLVSGGGDTVRTWNPVTGAALGKPVDGPGESVGGVAFSPDGTMLASTGDDGTVQIRAPAAVVAPRSLAANGDFPASPAFSRDGRFLAAGGSESKAVLLWDLTSPKPAARKLTGHREWVSAVDFSPDGALLASAGPDGVRLWDPRTGKAAQVRLEGANAPVNDVTFSPDGTRLAAAGDDRTLRLWDPRTGKRAGPPITGLTGAVQAVTFSPDGRLLASADSGPGNSIRLWDVSTSRMLGEPLAAGHTDDVVALAFSPDGRTLASAGGDRTVRLSATPATWVTRACERAGRNLSMREWEEHKRNTDYVRLCPGYPAGLGAGVNAPLAEYPALPDTYLHG